LGEGLEMKNGLDGCYFAIFKGTPSTTLSPAGPLFLVLFLKRTLIQARVLSPFGSFFFFKTNEQY
jgi:hypothetical protein